MSRSKGTGVPSWVASSAVPKPTVGGRTVSSTAVRSPVVPAPVGLGLDSAAVRQRMVQRLAAGGIQSQKVLSAMGQVQRHLFVDSALVNQAYRRHESAHWSAADHLQAQCGGAHD